MKPVAVQIVQRCGRLAAAALAVLALGYVSIHIGAFGATLFAPARPADSAATETVRAPGRANLAVSTVTDPAYAVPRYAPISSVRSQQYRMNRTLVREEIWQTRSEPWEIINYYATYFMAGLWEDVTDEQFGLTRNEADPMCPSHEEPFEDWMERYQRIRSQHLAVRRGGRSARLAVEPGARGVSTIRVLWAETPDLKRYLASLGTGMREATLNGGETRWTLGEDCRDCPEPDLQIVRFQGDVVDAKRRIAGEFAGDGWSRRMDLSDYPNAGDVIVWARDDQVRLVSLSPDRRGSGTDALIMTVRD